MCIIYSHKLYIYICTHVWTDKDIALRSNLYFPVVQLLVLPCIMNQHECALPKSTVQCGVIWSTSSSDACLKNTMALSLQQPEYLYSEPQAGKQDGWRCSKSLVRELNYPSKIGSRSRKKWNCLLPNCKEIHCYWLCCDEKIKLWKSAQLDSLNSQI